MYVSVLSWLTLPILFPYVVNQQIQAWLPPLRSMPPSFDVLEFVRMTPGTIIQNYKSTYSDNSLMKEK